MSATPFIAKKLKGLARVMEKPALLRARSKGVTLDLFEKINLRWLHDMKFATLFDIGAAIGEFSRAAHVAWPGIRIFAFEPIPNSFSHLQQTLSKIPGSEAINVAIGENNCDVSFEHSAARDASSLLKMADLHKSAFPHSVETQTITVKMEKLDTVAQRLSFSEPLIIKIDVQGYEKNVLKGGDNTIRQANVVITETSLEPLYQNQALFPQIYEHMRDRGFTFRGVLDQLRHPQDERVLQIDAIFVRD
jgi:FkbM family methyltransferase